MRHRLAPGGDTSRRRLATIPAIGPITPSAIAAAVPDVSLFRSGRQYAAWPACTLQLHSFGRKARLGKQSIPPQAAGRRATAVMLMTCKDAGRQSWLGS
ncbi:transposase [Sphingomonas beigongshangi]|uniref:transposase n=1 Tax=Sphingomonas beigongshangi TaxID=2782540 RepID=UPI001AEEED32